VKNETKRIELLLGILLFAAYSGVFVFISAWDYFGFLVAFAWAQVIIMLFTSKRWYYRAIAVLFSPILLFVVFLPKHLKTALKELEAKEAPWKC
jgi:hypothetical protein